MSQKGVEGEGGGGGGGECMKEKHQDVQEEDSQQQVVHVICTLQVRQLIAAQMSSIAGMPRQCLRKGPKGRGLGGGGGGGVERETPGGRSHDGAAWRPNLQWHDAVDCAPDACPRSWGEL